MKNLNFTWVVPDQLAGCAGPARDADLLFLKDRGITLLVRLVEGHKAKVTHEQVLRAGFDDLHEPVADFDAPSQEQIDRIVKAVRDHLGKGGRVAVSCGAGIGRTGTILSCILISLCRNVDDALEEVRRTCEQSRAWEVDVQCQAILTYAKRIGKT